MKVVFTGSQDIKSVHKLARAFGEKRVLIKDNNLEEIRSLLQEAGNKIASVHFIKRGDKSLRKMCYRLHVQRPTYANAPKNDSEASRRSLKTKNEVNHQMTVFDVNKVLRDDSGNILYDNETGRKLRGAWRTIPLENVLRVCIDGVTYEIEK